MTDENATYKELGAKEHARGSVFNNTTESFNAILEQAKVGVLHWISKMRLRRYVDEVVWRWNHREPVEKRDRRTSIRYIAFDPLEPLKLLAYLLERAVGRQVRRVDDGGYLQRSKKCCRGCHTSNETAVPYMFCMESQSCCRGTVPSERSPYGFVANFVASVQGSGRLTFSVGDIAKQTGATGASLQAALLRHAATGAITRISRKADLFVIVPPEYRTLGAILGKPNIDIFDTVKLAVRNWFKPSRVIRQEYKYRPTMPGQPEGKVKIEVNCTERQPFYAVVDLPYEPPIRGLASPVTLRSYDLDEMIGTKMRALLQRDQGRDLFDLWWALTAPTPKAAHRLDPQ